MTKDELNIQIGQQVRSYRERIGMSVDELERISGVAQTSLYRFERGRAVSTKYLAKILTGLGITLDQLFEFPAPRIETKVVEKQVHVNRMPIQIKGILAALNPDGVVHMAGESDGKIRLVKVDIAPVLSDLFWITEPWNEFPIQ